MKIAVISTFTIFVVLGILVAIFVVLGILVASYYLWKSKAKCAVRMENSRKNDHEIDDGQKEDLELPHFDFTALANATNHFSINNKLGEGGYGPVYRVNIINI
ncbi:hypothetical protein OIU76_028548 [Salix suchowensis]|nr:hypothetical protein OIU76_028548 [Salix suchowensis]